MATKPHPQDVFWLTRSDHMVCVWRGKPTRLNGQWVSPPGGAIIQFGPEPWFIFKMLCPHHADLRTDRPKRLGVIE